MQAPHGGGHVGGCHGGGYVQMQQVPQLNAYQQTSYEPTYQQLLPVVRHVLDVVLENAFEESVKDVTRWILFEFKFKDGTDISQWMNHQQPSLDDDAMMKARVLEALAHWIRTRAHALDAWVPVSQAGLLSDPSGGVRQQMQACVRNLEALVYQGGNFREILAEFVFSTVVDLLGREAACLASMLGGMLASQVHTTQEFIEMAEWPPKLLALLVRMLEEVQSKVSKIVMEMYTELRFLSGDDCKQILMMFFQFYTVETQGPAAGTLEVYVSDAEQPFLDSPFRVHLIDSFGCLMKLLLHIEGRTAAGTAVQLAVDFEGVKLNRTGALCLVQMTCSDDPRLVYVIDVFVLGKRAFTLTTAQGLSLKSLLESEDVRKVWFDPRNDVDALYHQFQIAPRGIFDLQLAEVAQRRNRGLNVQFVQGLYKCLTQCPELQDEQKTFAEMINRLGKSLFEPQNGGDYNVFLERPLNPVILVYAAHDSRYMLVLHEQYIASIGASWEQRVLQASNMPSRGGWWGNEVYAMPSSEAPEF